MKKTENIAQIMIEIAKEETIKEARRVSEGMAISQAKPNYMGLNEEVFTFEDNSKVLITDKEMIQEYF